MSWLAWWWAQVEGNALWSASAVVLAVALRRPLARWLDRVAARARSGTRDALADLRRELDGVRGAADRAHRIAADTHEHLTGQPHPDAPAKRRP